MSEVFMEQAIKDKAPKPAGLVPKNLQAFVLVGLALLMVLIMAITGHKRPVTASTGQAASLPNIVPVNTDKVTDLQKGIEQTQRESAPQAEEALLQRQRQLAAQGIGSAQPFPSSPYGTPVTSAYPNGAYPPGAYATALPQPSEGQTDPIREEQKKRAYLSLFSDNVALTYRTDFRAQDPAHNSSVPAIAGHTSNAPGVSNDPFSNQDQLVAQAGAELARQGAMLAQAQKAGLVPQTALTNNSFPAASARKGGDSGSQESSETSKPRTADPTAPRTNGYDSAEGKRYVLFEGTVLEALLINRLDGSFSGPVSCLLSTNVYSHDRQHVLIPAGSKILGEAKKVDTFGQVRLAVTFHRVIMPNGFSVNLDQFKGLDQEGATALKDKINNHYAKIFGASLAIGILGGVAQLGTSSTLDASGTDRIREGFGVGMASAGEHVLDRFLNILPTVTIREGSRIKVYLSNDLLLPDYAAHNLPSDI
jgi:type IV secretion system protein TrbI